MNAKNKLGIIVLMIAAGVVLIPWPTTKVAFKQSVPVDGNWSALETTSLKPTETWRQRIWVPRSDLVAIHVYGPHINATHLTGTIDDVPATTRQITDDEIAFTLEKPLVLTEQWIWLEIHNHSHESICLWFERDATKYPDGQLERVGSTATQPITGVLAFSLWQWEYRWLGR